MSDVGGLVVRAIAPDVDAASRYAAFEELVLRFQDMAFACAYSRLGDRGLAEDAAQDAFVSAWLNLDQLRSAEAFPGWFRQTVLRHCNRIALRRPVAVSLGAIGEIAADDDLADGAEKLALRETLGAWVETLPEHERVTVLLFYIGEYSQSEVAAFLGVSPNAVKQRLHSARQRLKGRFTEMMSDNLKGQGVSRDSAFVERVRLRLRAFGGDYEGLAALLDRSEVRHDAGHLDADDDALEWLANRRRFDQEGLIPSAYTVEDEKTGERLAYGCIERVDVPIVGDYPPTGRPGTSTFRLHFVVAPGVAANEVAALTRRLEADAAGLGAEKLWCRDTSEHLDVIDVLHGEGFEETRRVYEWHVVVDEWKLSARQGEASSVSIGTLRQAMEKPGYLDSLHAFWNAPGTKTSPQESFTVAEIEERLRSASIVPELYFLAWQEGRVVGALILRRPHEATSSTVDFYFKVLDEAPGGVEERLLASAVEYGRARARKTLTAYFSGEFNRVEYLRGLGLQPSIELIVVEKVVG